MAETHRERTPTWAAILAGAIAALLVAGVIYGWVQMQGVAREVDLHVGPSVPQLPAPRLPEAPRLPDAPIPTPR